MKNALMIGIAGLALAACSNEAAHTPAPETQAAAPETVEAVQTAGAVSMETILAGNWRSERNKARDKFRNPAETLAFFDVSADETVIEIAPGGGWYTEVIAPYLAAGGGTYIATTRGDAERDGAFKEKFSDAETFGTINLAVLGGEGITPGTVDTVLTFRNIHNWMSNGTEAEVFANAYAALKPGGVFGVIEHRLPSSAEQNPQANTGYVHEDYAIELGKAAGFELADTSEINANPKDTADHPFGVWTLPPASFAGNEQNPAPEGFDPAKYKAIGESDRFTLKFVKPLNAASVTETAVQKASAAEETETSPAAVVEGPGGS